MNVTDFVSNLALQKAPGHASSAFSPTSSLPATDKKTIDQAADLLKTLAHPLRIRIVLALGQRRSMNVSALQRQLNVEQAILSYQLTKMRARGVLTSVRQGQEIHYSLTNIVLSEIMLLLLSGKMV